jgi:hypothetical protein
MQGRVRDSCGKLAMDKDIYSILDQCKELHPSGIALACISPNWTREVCIDRTGESIMAEGIAGHAARIEVLCRKHASSGHNPHKSVKRGFRRVLFGVNRYSCIDDTQLTRHLSNESAKAPELDTSNVRPLRFCKISWSFSKFVRGGGKWRLPR